MSIINDLLTFIGVIEYLGLPSVRIFSSELPHVKERFPVYILNNIIKVYILIMSSTQKRRSFYKQAIYGMLTMELSSYLLEIPNDAYTTLNQFW